MFAGNNDIQVYKNFFEWAGKSEMFRMRKNHTLEYSDLAPLAYLHIALEGKKPHSHIKHILIDEMQDYSPIPVSYTHLHKITMPSSVQGATIQGAIDQIVHGMDFTCKIMPVSVADAVTVSINGKIVADRQGVAQIKVESVREDLDITIQVGAAGDETLSLIHI